MVEMDVVQMALQAITFRDVFSNLFSMRQLVEMDVVQTILQAITCQDAFLDVFSSGGYKEIYPYFSDYDTVYQLGGDCHK
ncbi:MAG: hypothetical protein GY696_31030 [Gammaproteobacteria bacterium]|nr:hypothetical protein [Gammaproteobacteria bacterium]